MKLAVLSDLVSGYGENVFSAGVCYGDGHFEGCKNVGVEGFVNVICLKVAFCIAAV